MGVGNALARLVGLEGKSASLSIRDTKDARVWGRLFGWGETAAGKSVTVDTAMQVSAFWACVKLLAETIATLPLGIYNRDAQGGRVPANDHPLAYLLRVTPDGEHTAVEFWEGAVLSLCLHGDAFAEKVRAGGRIIALQPLLAEWMVVRRNEDGALVYEYSDPRGLRSFTEDAIFHLRAFGGAGNRGLSPLRYARQTIGSAIAADEAAGKLFANGVRPSGVLEVGQVLKPDQRKDLKENIVAPLAGAQNAGGVFVLEGGMKFTAISLSPADSQLLETRRWHVEEIARWFGIPPILIGHASQGQTMWGTGVEQIALSWLTLGLRSQLRRIEAAIQLRLIEPAERSRIYAEFAVEGLLRADSAGRAALYASFAQNGIMDRDEIREKENLPKRGGGAAALTVQSNLLPIDQLGDAPVSLPQRQTGQTKESAEKRGGALDDHPFDFRALTDLSWFADRLATKAFNPGQRRDARGRWTSGFALALSAVGLGGKPVRATIGKVSQAMAYRSATGLDVRGYSFTITNQGLSHIRKKRPALLAQESDFALLKSVLQKPDQVMPGTRSGANGQPRVQVEKTIAGRRYGLVGEVHAGKRRIEIITVW